MAALLCRTIRYRRGEQHVLPFTRGLDIFSLACPGAGGFPVRCEGEPVSDAHEAVTRSAGADRAALLPRPGTRSVPRPRAVSVARQFPRQPAAAGLVPVRVAPVQSARLRV